MAVPALGISTSIPRALDAVSLSYMASLQARNQQGGGLAWLLTGARVVGTRGQEVSVKLADGRVDRWTISYRRGRWQVDYHALPEESPFLIFN